MPIVDVERDAAHDAAQNELNKPIYPRSTLSERLGDWLDELIYRIAAQGSGIPGGFFTVAVLAILLVVAIVVAVRIARKAMHTNRDVESALFDTAELTALQHRGSAEQYAAQGDWAAAIRHRLRAVARQLEEAGVLDPVPGRTAYELARAAGAAIPELSHEFTKAAIAFNDVAFGDRPGTAQAYQLISELDDRLRAQHRAVTR